jgi:hypothetical protein
MQLPLQIIQLGTSKVNRTVETRDISSGGVCFHSDDVVEVGGRIEYLITLSGSAPPVKIRCLGKVVRSQSLDNGGAPFEVAVTMERYQFLNPKEMQAFAVAS